ncbi:MAG: biotin/lipoyl-binding protein [Sphingobacteriales bacterium]|nr:biotin/lipoyl-binding protein [Sphingobacteriales bacterium]MBI3718808.1 biotin/lipoyl-binding protein [Sphingobacteriales bacterium]
MPDSKTAYKVKSNAFEFSFSKEEIESADLVKISPNEFNLIKDNRSVTARLISTDSSGKKVTVEVEGETFDMEIKDELDILVDQMGFSTATTKHVKEIKAPMPGLVLEIDVTEGQALNEGDKILILEAMKMENSIMIQTNAVIKRIAVKSGQAVEKGQLLVELE